MTTKTYVLYNHESYDCEQTVLCVVDPDAWPHFEVLARARGWSVLGDIDGSVRWRSDKECPALHAGGRQTGPLGALTNPFSEHGEPSIGSIIGPSEPHEIDRSMDWTEKLRAQVRHWSQLYAEIASPAEAQMLYEATRRSHGGDRVDSLGKTTGIWALISDEADPLLQRYLDAEGT